MPNIFDIRMQSKQHKYSLCSRQTNDWKMSIEWEKEMCDEYELQKQKKATRESRRKEKTTMNLHKKDTTNCTLTKFYSLIVYTLLFFSLSHHTFVHLRAHMSICLDYLHAKKIHLAVRFCTFSIFVYLHICEIHWSVKFLFWICVMDNNVVLSNATTATHTHKKHMKESLERTRER